MTSEASPDVQFKAVATSRFNFLPAHAFLILNKNISIQNATHSVAFLHWFKEMNPILAWTPQM